MDEKIVFIRSELIRESKLRNEELADVQNNLENDLPRLYGMIMEESENREVNLVVI